MIVKTYRQENIILADDPIAAGGEGEVRIVHSAPERFKNVCAKLYFKPNQTKEQEKKIRFMVENPPSSIVSAGMMLAWPLETIYKTDGRFIGFIMPTAFSESKKLVILTLPKLKNAHKVEWYKFDKELDIKTALISRLQLIKNIAIPIHLLHSTNKYVLKDFKPDNILVTPTGQVTIVDMDSIQICDNGKLLFSGTAATENYIPPEFYNSDVGRDPEIPLNKSWDNFAVGEVFYQLLFGLNPYAVTPKADTDDCTTISYCITKNLFPFGKNASKIAIIPTPHNNFNIIPQPVKELFIRAFGDDPSNRPEAMEWGKTINSIVAHAAVSINPPKPPKIQNPVIQNPEPAKYCPECGYSNPMIVKFCKNCGSSFETNNPFRGNEVNIAIVIVIAVVLLFLATLVIL